MKKDNILSNETAAIIFIEQIGFEETFTVKKRASQIMYINKYLLSHNCSYYLLLLSRERKQNADSETFSEDFFKFYGSF